MGHAAIYAKLYRGKSDENYNNEQLKALGAQLLGHNYNPSAISDRKLRGILRDIDPALVQPLSRQEQERRGALSEMVRQRMVESMANMISKGIPAVYGVADTGDRSFKHLFDYSDAPEAEAYNLKAAAVLKSGTPRERADFIYNHCLEKVIPQVTEALEMGPQELMDNFERLYHPICFVQEVVKLSGEAEFTPEQAKLLRDMEKLMYPAMQLFNMVDLIAQPQYKNFRLEEICRLGETKSTDVRDQLINLGRTLGEKDTGLGEGSLHTMGVTLNTVGLQTIFALGDRAALDAQQKGAEPILYSTNGKLLTNEEAGKSLLRGEPVLAPPKGQGSMVPIYLEQAWETPRMSEDVLTASASLTGYMVRQVQSMLQQTRDADPWWMASGSREYQQMIRAMEDFAECGAGKSYPLLGRDGQLLEERAAAMLESCNAYLARKMEQRGDALQPKNEREAARIRAAQGVQELMGHVNFLLSNSKDPSRFIQQGKQDMQALEAQAANRAAAARSAGPKARQEEPAKSDLPEHLQCKSNRSAMVAKAEESSPALEPEFEGDLLPAFQKSALEKLKSIGSMALRNQQPSGTHAMIMTKHMAVNITLQVILAERQQFRVSHPGQAMEPGPLEKMLMQKRGANIETNIMEDIPGPNGSVVNPFKALKLDLSPAGMEKFIMEAQWKDLAREYVSNLSKLAPEQSRDGAEKQGTELDRSAEREGQSLGENSPKPSTLSLG